MFALVCGVWKTWWMAFDYISVDRDQQFLLPPDMREWLPAGHLVWFVLEVVERVDTSGLHARHPRDGVGRRAYDPDMLLALLVYAYCTGQRSSRQIERLCEVDVAYRVICANSVPDHTTIARFRQGHQDEAVQLFTDVLMMCAACGLAKVGTIAVDGTKIAAVASLKANRTRAQVEAEVARMIVEADEVDRGEDDLFGGSRGDGLPVELVDPRTRKARLDAAVAELDRARLERKEVERVEAQAKIDAGRRDGRRVTCPVAGTEVDAAIVALELARSRAVEHRNAVVERAAREGRSLTGRPPGERSPMVARAEQRLQRARARQAARDLQQAAQDLTVRVNTSDPDSRIMKSKQGWVQGFNAQAAANDNGVVVAGAVTSEGNDSLQCQPMIAATLASLSAAGIVEPVGIVLFDAGYISDDNLRAPGPDRLIATGKSHTLRKSAPTCGPPPAGLSATAAMEHRLRTPEGAEAYKKRQHIIEPVFGTIKEARGYRRFSRRGLDAVTAEWFLILAAHNINKAFKHA